VVCIVFLLHFRSAFVAVFTLPMGILIAFAAMYHQGVNSNIMSLGGIAIAIGAMVDAAIVMIENAHKHIERDGGTKSHSEMIIAASKEVGPALFFSLLIITLSFLPVFTLEAQEGRLFKPLAYTKTYAMAAAAFLAITVVPVLMTFFVRGKIRSEAKNPISRVLIYLYRPVIDWVLRHRVLTVVLGGLVLFVTVFPFRDIVVSRFSDRPQSLTYKALVKLDALFPMEKLDRNLCRLCTRAICCICPRHCRGYQLRGRGRCCNRPIKLSALSQKLNTYLAKLVGRRRH